MGIQYLAIGHTARDEFPDGRWRFGGSALYGAATAARLGAEVVLVTRVGPGERVALAELCSELGIALHAVPSPVTTTFAFSYDHAGARTLRLRARAAPIELADVQRAMHRPRAVLLGSIAAELGASLFVPYTGSARVLAAQGLLRAFTADGRVVPRRWAGYAKLLSRVDAVVVSEEDHAEVASWLPYTTVVVTQADRGADVYRAGAKTHVRAFPVPQVVDPTGAGDVYAAALALGLAEGQPLLEAAVFASAAASFAVEGWGLAGLANRASVEARLRAGAA